MDGPNCNARAERTGAPVAGGDGGRVSWAKTTGGKFCGRCAAAGLIWRQIGLPSQSNTSESFAFHAQCRFARSRRRPGDASLSADQVPQQAGGAAGGEVSADRYSAVELHQQRDEPDLRADAVSLREPAPAHSPDLSLRRL